MTETTPETTPFGTVLIANRGEIACRIIRTLRARGIRSVAVYSDADASALHVRLADEAVRLGPAPAAESYLDVDAVLAAARATGAQAIHPGYGFLAENASFARACEDAGIVFVGPGVDAIGTMGDKIAAKIAVQARGVPTVPGVARRGMTDDELIAAAPEVGYPMLVKPSAGGGGKGMHVVERADDLPAALAAARREARASFGDDTLFLERYVRAPRHIEVQVLADAHGAVVHLGERECSLQRRHQKVIEEAPSPLLDARTRERIGRAACETARSVGYRGAGTVEFIVSAEEPEQFFFMEMNTRLQVEHPVTEEVTGIDLVAAQLRIAAGEPLGLIQEDIALTGHSFEARVYAEDPAAGFLPTGGRVARVVHPVGEGIRVDTALVDGLDVSVAYDPMLAKIIAHGATRDEARRRLAAALGDTAVFGFATNVAFLRALLERPEVVDGTMDTGLIARVLPELPAPRPDRRAFEAAALLLDAGGAGGWPGEGATDASAPGAGGSGAGGPWLRGDGWRLGAPAPRRYALEHDGQRESVAITGPRERPAIVRDGDGDGDGNAESDAPVPARILADGTNDGASPAAVVVEIGGQATRLLAASDGDTVHLGIDGAVFAIRPARPTSTGRESAADADPVLASPMPGTIVQALVADGARVDAGDAVVVVEAMKMEHVVRAAVGGTVTLRAAPGDVVARGQALAVVASVGAGDEGAEG